MPVFVPAIFWMRARHEQPDTWAYRVRAFVPIGQRPPNLFGKLHQAAISDGIAQFSDTPFFICITGW